MMVTSALDVDDDDGDDDNDDDDDDSFMINTTGEGRRRVAPTTITLVRITNPLRLTLPVICSAKQHKGYAQRKCSECRSVPAAA
jgi:hypothetical protein